MSSGIFDENIGKISRRKSVPPPPLKKKPLKICLIPCNNGAEFAFKNLVDNFHAEIFALQRSPTVARIVKNLESVQCCGNKKILYMANLKLSENHHAQQNKTLLENIFQISTRILPNFLTISLNPSNNILHTSRLYGLFNNLVNEKSYETIPLFYGNWDDQSSEILLKMDDELQKIIKKLSQISNVDLSQIVNLRNYYGDLTKTKIIQNPLELTHKLKSIKSLAKLTTPNVVIANQKLIPNFASRYFCDDFAFGLNFLLEIARLLNFSAKDLSTLHCVMNWYESLNLQQPKFKFVDYQIENLTDFLNFYK